MAAKKPFELTPAQQKRFDKCYGVYRKKASRGVCEQTWGKYDFDDEMTLKIFDAIVAQNLADKNETPIKFIKGFAVFLNNSGWKDEIESKQEKQFKSVAHKCKCGLDSKHKGGYCDKCYTELCEKIPGSDAHRDRESLRDYFAKHLVGLSTEELRSRAKVLAGRIGK